MADRFVIIDDDGARVLSSGDARALMAGLDDGALTGVIGAHTEMPLWSAVAPEAISPAPKPRAALLALAVEGASARAGPPTEPGSLARSLPIAWAEALRGIVASSVTVPLVRGRGVLVSSVPWQLPEALVLTPRADLLVHGSLRQEDGDFAVSLEVWHLAKGARIANVAVSGAVDDVAKRVGRKLVDIARDALDIVGVAPPGLTPRRWTRAHLATAADAQLALCAASGLLPAKAFVNLDAAADAARALPDGPYEALLVCTLAVALRSAGLDAPLADARRRAPALPASFTDLRTKLSRL